MDILDQLGVALGLASLAGVNLYLTVFLVGLSVRFNWIDLFSQYEQFAVLGSPVILGVAGGLFLVEFFADKVPWVDSAWDSVHTLVRPIGGTMLAMAALGELDQEFTVIAGLLSGGASLITHATKASTRLVLNMSPEPVSNMFASVAEDGLVVGGLGLVAFLPGIAFFAFIIVLIGCVFFIYKLSGALRRVVMKIRGRRNDVAVELTEA